MRNQYVTLNIPTVYLLRSEFWSIVVNIFAKKDLPGRVPSSKSRIVLEPSRTFCKYLCRVQIWRWRWLLIQFDMIALTRNPVQYVLVGGHGSLVLTYLMGQLELGSQPCVLRIKWRDYGPQVTLHNHIDFVLGQRDSRAGLYTDSTLPTWPLPNSTLLFAHS